MYYIDVYIYTSCLYCVCVCTYIFSVTSYLVFLDTLKNSVITDLELVKVLFLYFNFFAFSRATPMAYGGFQARGLIRAVEAGLCQSHSNGGSEPHL